MTNKTLRSNGLGRRSFLNTLGALGASQMLGAGMSRAATVTAAGANPQPVPTGPVTNVTVGLNGIIQGNIGLDFCGLSYEKSALSTPLFNAKNANLTGLFNLLGDVVLRIGGHSVDLTNWDPNGVGQVAGIVSPPDIAALAAFVKTTGWKVIYGVNFAQSKPETAASEVAYAAPAFGSSLWGIQLGNGPDIYNQGLYPVTWGPSDFLTQWQSYASAIQSQSPGVRLIGPGTTNQASWFDAFAQAESSRVVALTHNYYRGNGTGVTLADIVSYPDTKLLSWLAALRASASSVGVQFRLSETNSYFGGAVPGVTNSYASALWVIDHLFTTALGGASGANLHGGGNSAGYTPIGDSNGVVVGPRPEYFGMYMVTQAGPGQVEAPDLIANGLNVSAYAVHAADGGLSIVVVNKDATQTLNLTVAAGVAVNSAELTLLTNSSLGALTGTTIQGAAIGSNGSFSPGSPYTLTTSGRTIDCYVNPASAALIQVNYQNRRKDRTLPPWLGKPS